MKLFPSPKANNTDALIGAFGAALAMAITWLVSDALLDSVSPILALSMGASAVILFTMPTAPAAQPVPMILAHCVAAFLGVLSAQIFNNTALAVGVAVGVHAGTDGSLWLHASTKWWNCVNRNHWWQRGYRPWILIYLAASVVECCAARSACIRD